MFWSLRRGFWNGLAILKMRGNKPAVVTKPKVDRQPIETVSLARFYNDAIPIKNIPVAATVPDDEEEILIWQFHKFQVSMYTKFPPNGEGMAQIDADPKRALSYAYTKAHAKYFPAPVIPEAFQGDRILEETAVRGPYYNYLEKIDEDHFHWDLRDLSRFEHLSELRNLGVRVLFRVDREQRCLKAELIESELGNIRPGDRQWIEARRLALTALTNHCSLFRHFNWVHLAVGSPFALAVRNKLPANHILCPLLWPHIFRTQSSNRNVTYAQMSAGGDFDGIFSFTHKGMLDGFRTTFNEYDITNIDPQRYASKYGFRNAGFETPSLKNHEELFQVMHDHALRYLQLYYSSDEALMEDGALQQWLQALDSTIPGGVLRVFPAQRSLAELARLVGGLIYMATALHDQLGTFLWNYQNWPHIQPTRVYRDGHRIPVDVYQRLINANYNLNVRRTKLMQDFGYLVTDSAGQQEFTKFLEELKSLQKRMEADDGGKRALWKIYPDMLEANINS